MLRNFAAVLLATTLIAGPAFAAQPSGDAGATSTAAPHAVVKHTAKHMRTHVRKHVTRGKVAAVKLVRHGKSAKTHRSHIVHTGKPAKVTKGAAS